MIIQESSWLKDEVSACLNKYNMKQTQPQFGTVINGHVESFSLDPRSENIRDVLNSELQVVVLDGIPVTLNIFNTLINRHCYECVLNVDAEGNYDSIAMQEVECSEFSVDVAYFVNDFFESFIQPRFITLTEENEVSDFNVDVEKTVLQDILNSKKHFVCLDTLTMRVGAFHNMLNSYGLACAFSPLDAYNGGPGLTVVSLNSIDYTSSMLAPSSKINESKMGSMS